MQVGALQEQTGQLAEKLGAAEARAAAAEQASQGRSQQLVRDLEEAQSQCKQLQVAATAPPSFPHLSQSAVWTPLPLSLYS